MKNIIANFCDTIQNDLHFAQVEMKNGNLNQMQDWIENAKKNLKFLKTQVEKL